MSLTGLGPIIAEEWNYMERYTFFKVRNVASKGNTSRGNFTTPHASYFTENINKKRNESLCLTDFRPRLLWLGNTGKYCNFPALSGRIKIRGFKQTQKFLQYFTRKEVEILLS